MTNENNTNYLNMRNNFYKRFKEKCTPLLEKFEKERKVFIKIFIVLILVIISVLLSFLAYSLYLQDSFAIFKDLSLPISFAFIIIIGGIVFYSKVFENRIKKELMPILCRCFENLKWVESPRVNHSLFKNSGIITKRYDEYDIDDVFVGSFKDVSIEIVEVEYVDITRERTSDGKTRVQRNTIFDGVIITLDMNKNFISHTLVKSDKLFKTSGVQGLRHTTLEDPIFEKSFDVFTNDEVDARYLLTPSFMERLVNVKTIYNSSKITCAFYNDKLILAMDVRRDMFKIGSLFKKVNDEKAFMKMYEELESIIKLIDHFKLDQKIGL